MKETDSSDIQQKINKTRISTTSEKNNDNATRSQPHYKIRHHIRGWYSEAYQRLGDIEKIAPVQSLCKTLLPCRHRT